MNSILKHNFFIPILISCTLISCEKQVESVYFEEKQPIEVSDVKTFNKKFQGRYIHSGDSSILEITKDKLIQSNFFHLHFHRNDIDSSFKGNKNNNDEVISALAKMNMTGRIVEDSIFALWEIRDTTFRLADQNSIRFFKGFYFLNTYEGENAWTVRRLAFVKKNNLQISTISPYDSLFKFSAITNITEIKDDSGRVVNYSLKPTKKEMKNLMKANAFTGRESWIKLK